MQYNVKCYICKQSSTIFNIDRVKMYIHTFITDNIQQGKIYPLHQPHKHFHKESVSS